MWHFCEAQTCNLLYQAINYEENYIHHDIKLGHLEITSSLKIELTGFGWSLIEMSSIWLTVVTLVHKTGTEIHPLMVEDPPMYFSIPYYKR